MADEGEVPEVNRLRDWIEQFPGLWTHVHFTGLALRFHEQWVIVAASAILSDRERRNPPVGVPIVKASRVLAIRTSLPIETLDQLLIAGVNGVLRAGDPLKLEHDLFLTSPPGSRPQWADFREFVRPTALPYQFETNTIDTWPHAELQFKGPSLSDWLKNDPGAYRSLELEDRRFPRYGHGSLATFVHRLGLKKTDEGHFDSLWRQQVVFKVAAPIFARLHAVPFDRDRQSLFADVELGPTVLRSKASVAVVSDDPHTWVRSKRTRSRRKRVRILIARGLPAGKATVHLSVDPIGEVGKLEADIEPPPRPWPLLHALRGPTGDLALIREGIQAGQPSTPSKWDPASEFDRAIHLLLSALGYSAVWWGTGKVRPPRGFQVGAEADQLAYSTTRNEILVVESTIVATGGDKVHKLVGRTLALRDRLNEEMKRDAPPVRALLALPVPRTQVPPATKGALRDNGAGLLSRDEALGLLDLMSAGEPPEKVDAVIDRLFTDLDGDHGLVVHRPRRK